MKTAEVELPDSLFRQIEGLSRELDITVPDLLRRAAEDWLRNIAASAAKPGSWTFPEARSLGRPLVPVEEWTLHANENSPD
jgi:hypothetical protein